MLFYLLSKSPRDGSEHESLRAEERAPASPSVFITGPVVRWMGCALSQGRASGQVAGKHGGSSLGTRPTWPALLWEVTLSKAGEIVITAPVRPSNFALGFTMHKSLVL